MEHQSTYRIRTKLGETEPINIPISLMQEYNSFEILSLNINTNETYRSYTSTEGIVVGRVSTANNGLGIPNVRVSIFVPKNAYDQSDEEKVIYPFSSPTDLDGDRVRYNLLPSESDVLCYQVIGTMPSKRRILDNETVCEVFEKYYKYTTVTNEAGDFMLTNIPVGNQKLHIDADLSDIGPFLSQKPYNMIDSLGIDQNKFESSTQFKYSKDLNSLAQVISQDKSIYVYPYWGDSTENSSEMKITRTDLSLNYEFNTNAIFIGSVITDKGENGVRQNCTPSEKAGKMSEMITGSGRIEMIRKTVDNKVEQFRIKGDELINENGVWCYSIPMNLDYVRTDEFGNIIPTDDPNKGVPTRARVRFRVTLSEMQSDSDAHKRASFLIPNNPNIDDEKFLKENTADYSFGTETWDESFVDLFWNKVYTVKSFIPRMQKSSTPTNRKHSGIKMVNHYGDNNPFPYNSLTIRLNFLYRLICVIIHIFVILVTALNGIFSLISEPICVLYNVLNGVGKIPLVGYIFKKIANVVKKLIIPCVSISSEFCDDGVNKNETYPGCFGCSWNDRTKPECESEQKKKSERGEESVVCTKDDDTLLNCIENQLAQDNEATSFNFSNDWINGCLYMPLWYRHIKPKRSYFFGLIKRSAKDQYCAGENNVSGHSLKLLTSCANTNGKEVTGINYRGKEVSYNIAAKNNNCTTECHKKVEWVNLSNGFVIKRETMLGQTAWYYKSAEIVPSNAPNVANEYLNYEGTPMISKTLYATDIVMIGSLNDCDSNGIPKFFNSLKGTTYNMPTDVLFSDIEIEYNDEKNGEQEVSTMSIASGCDWGNKNEYGHYDGGLFYSIGCSEIKVDDGSCMNLRRICELGVGLDEIQYIDNLNVNVQSENDKLNYNENDYYLRPDGFISYDDIIDTDYRSMFATLNSNRLKTKINSENGVKEYDFRNLYIDNFDGSMYEIMRSEQQNRTNANYRYNYNLEQTNLDYLTFRMGDNPFFYDGKSLVSSEINKNEGPHRYSLPKYQNSFYFYFGLKDGKTAIDLFNEKYNAPCAPKVNEDIKETIPYEKQSNGWCCMDEDIVIKETNKATYDHSTYDGYLKLNLDDLPLPCTAILNLKDDSSVTYTVVDEENNVSINHSRICFYGENSTTKDDIKLFKGYQKYYLRYENITKELPESADKCQMLNNGEYELTITDSEGNYHSFIIDLSGAEIDYGFSIKNFGMINDELISYYGNYDNVAKSPQNKEDETTKQIITNEIIVEGNEIPNVYRFDKDKNLLIDGVNAPVKLNGTICIYNPLCGSVPLDDLLIEIEPYDKIKNEEGIDYYSDSDFWLDDDKTKTWYQKKMFTHHDNDLQKSIICNDASVFKDDDNVEYVYADGLSQYFYYTTININKIDIRCYIIKCPKGDVNYRVRITQICSKTNADGGIDYYKTNNFVEQKISVGQSSPYKLYINDINYDIIKNFNTGWNIRVNQKNAQTMLHTGPSPFVQNKPANLCEGIKGWLEIGDINKNYNWSAEEDKYGKNEMVFEKNGYTYNLKELIKIKEENEPKEPQRKDYEKEEEYNEEYEKWEEAHEQWENGAKDKNGNRIENFDKWDIEIQKEEEHIIVNGYDIGCVCGYKYMADANEILNNRLEFVAEMKNAFWLQDASNGHSINYSVQTDSPPYEIWTMYAPEIISEVDGNYNETDSAKSSKRIDWYYTGESALSITDIKIPTITQYQSVDFGCANDEVRKNKRDAFGELWGTGSEHKFATMCYSQDNIAKDSEIGSISIKPPYMVACVNAEGLTKPNNLTKGNFFNEEVNAFGIKKNSFGAVNHNNQYLSDGTNKFFMFHLIDKIFKADIVCWSYMYDMPKFTGGEGYSWKYESILVTAEGLLAGNILNGITSSYEYVNDFEEKTIFGRDVCLKKYNSDNEESIPTRRCILYSDSSTDIDDETLTYRNYRHTSKNEVSDENQFIPIKRGNGALSFIDAKNNSIESELYGSMQIITKDGGQGKLSVQCKNCGSEDSIMYYIFNANDKVYPINGFMFSESDEKWYMDCKGETDPWDGKKPAAMFNKNTTNAILEEMSDKECTSRVIRQNSSGEEVVISTRGYGNDGTFTIANGNYFVVAVANNGCRTISSIYEFGGLNTLWSIVHHDGANYMRIGIEGIINNDGKYNHYYLAQFDYTVNVHIFNKKNEEIETLSADFFAEEMKYLDYEEWLGSPSGSRYCENGIESGEYTVRIKRDSEMYISEISYVEKVPIIGTYFILNTNNNYTCYRKLLSSDRWVLIKAVKNADTNEYLINISETDTKPSYGEEIDARITEADIYWKDDDFSVSYRMCKMNFSDPTKVEGTSVYSHNISVVRPTSPVNHTPHFVMYQDIILPDDFVFEDLSKITIGVTDKTMATNYNVALNRTNNNGAEWDKFTYSQEWMKKVVG